MTEYGPARIIKCHGDKFSDQVTGSTLFFSLVQLNGNI